ncbi:hypothetical protein ABT329_40790, partial [Streptomyces minutiscleroticus]
HLTVVENLVEAPVSALRRPRAQAEETARRLLRMHDLLVNRAGRSLQSEFGLPATGTPSSPS